MKKKILFPDDIILKPHQGIGWKPLLMSHLINWPLIEITFKSEDIHFVRGVIPDYTRFLHLNDPEYKMSNARLIESIEISSNNKQIQCFTLNFVRSYIEEYVSVLTEQVGVGSFVLEEIETILNNFLQDIEEININNSMATNSQIVFKLSPHYYVSNKKSNTDIAKIGSIGFCEIMQPKVELVLREFKAVQKNTPHLSFVSTDNMRRDGVEGCVLPKILYRCTFCNVKFKGHSSKLNIIRHFYDNHQLDKDFMFCHICKKQMDIFKLATFRWKHVCQLEISPNKE